MADKGTSSGSRTSPKIEPQPAAEGTKNAISAAFIANESAIKRFLTRFFGWAQDIEEMTQETFLKAFQAAKSREISEPKAFLFGVARNVARKRLQKNSQALLEFVEDLCGDGEIEDSHSLEDEIDSRQRLLIFAEAVSTLPSQCQRVFVMKKVYGLSHKEISRQLGISVSTVEKHVANGLLRCGEYMKRREQLTSSVTAITPSQTSSGSG